MLSGVFAQLNEKLGYINSDSLIPLIPGRDSALAVIKAMAGDDESRLASLNSRYNSLYDAFRKDSASLSGDSAKTVIVKLLKLKKKINDFKTSAKDALNKKQKEILHALITKAEKAIAAVAKENGYTYIINTSLTNGVVLIYADKSGDIMPMVKRELGIKE